VKIRFQNIALAVAAIFSTAAARDSSSGYLATVGPPALRFRVLSTSVTPLPPLGSGDKPLASLVSPDSAADSEELKTQPATHKSEDSARKANDPWIQRPDWRTNRSLLLQSCLDMTRLRFGNHFPNVSVFRACYQQQSQQRSHNTTFLYPAQPVARLSSSVKYTSAQQ
jgi:hypothetical protein